MQPGKSFQTIGIISRPRRSNLSVVAPPLLKWLEERGVQAEAVVAVGQVHLGIGLIAVAPEAADTVEDRAVVVAEITEAGELQASRKASAQSGGGSQQPFGCSPQRLGRREPIATRA